MYALRWHDARDLRVEQIAKSSPGPGEVEVEVAYCGICGSDLHEYMDGPHAIPTEVPHPISQSRAPLTLGHEFCGTIGAVGDEVHGFAPGQRVVIEPEYRCGRCFYCRQGQYNLCDGMGFVGLMGHGAMAESVVVPTYMLHHLPEAISFKAAALIEPAAVALHALRRSSLRLGEHCVVFGLGPIGLLLIALARLQGASRVIAVDVVRPRLDKAGEMGASDLFHGNDPDVVDRIVETTNGLGVDVAFEATGAQPGFDGCLRALKRSGETVLVGLIPKAQFNAFDVINCEQRILTSVGYRHAYPDLIEMLAGGALDIENLVTREVGLRDAVVHGFEALATRPEDIKILVDPHQG